MGLMPTPGEEPAPQEEQPARDPARYTDDTDSNVSPEEQAQYSKFEENFTRLIYTPDGGIQPGLLESLAPGGAQAQPEGEAPASPAPEQEGLMGQEPGAGGNPDDEAATPGAGGNPAVLALANTAVTIVEKLDDSARKANKPLTDAVLTQGGAAVIEELADVSADAKLYDYSEEEIAGAVALAMEMYRPKAIADGRTDEETLKNQWGEIVTADKEGRAGQVVPGLQE